MFEKMEWKGREREGTDAEIEAMSLQKMKAVLLSTWDDLSHRSDFEQVKEDIVEKHKGRLDNFLSDLLTSKVYTEKDAAETTTTTNTMRFESSIPNKRERNHRAQ